MIYKKSNIYRKTNWNVIADIPTPNFSLYGKKYWIWEKNTGDFHQKYGGKYGELIVIELNFFVKQKVIHENYKELNDKLLILFPQYVQYHFQNDYFSCERVMWKFWKSQQLYPKWDALIN